MHVYKSQAARWTGTSYVGVICGCLTPAQFTQLLLSSVRCRGEYWQCQDINVKVYVITIFWQIFTEVNSSSHVNESVLWSTDTVGGLLLDCCTVGDIEKLEMTFHQGVTGIFSFFSCQEGRPF